MFERIRTAIILVILVMLCMFSTSNPLPMIALMALMVGIAAHEWTKLMPKVLATAPAMSFVALMVLLAVGAIFTPMIWMYIWGVALLIWVVSLIWVKQYPRATQWYSAALLPLGSVLLIAAVVAIYALWQLSPWWLMYVFALVWGADSGAYFVGRVFGKNKLAPNVSPNKSIEGLLGGLLTTTVVVLCVAFWQLKLTSQDLIYFLVLSLIAVIASVQGDLFESMVKRKAGIKDSGKILPGHGGVLDRIDSLMAAAPVFALGLWVHQCWLGGF